mmetsp:Transcript_21669/g.35047  ORF Transcript_21669/g.35047 Transcript_21669/m.35047 type:complete len:85 (+) Transcript_21669:101-355(+)
MLLKLNHFPNQMFLPRLCHPSPNRLKEGVPLNSGMISFPCPPMMMQMHEFLWILWMEILIAMRPQIFLTTLIPTGWLRTAVGQN